MASFRVAIDASVCVSVDADTAEEAMAKAKELATDDYVDGLSVPTGNRLDMRVYLSETAEPSIEDVQESDDEDEGA